MNVLYLSQDFLGINFEMAFQRTDYENGTSDFKTSSGCE